MDMNQTFETKVAQHSDVTHDDVLQAFEAFKDANDDRLAQIEKRMSADVITTEKVDRINKAVDELILKSRRPVLSAERSANRLNTSGLLMAICARVRPMAWRRLKPRP